MHEMDGRARRTVEDAVLIVHAQTVPKRKCWSQSCARQEGSLAGGEIGTSGGGVVGAGPAAQENLGDQEQQTHGCETAQHSGVSGWRKTRGRERRADSRFLARQM